MKANSIPAIGLAVLALSLVALLVGGCASPKTDWQARVGSYTYDQAVMEMGPPDKSSKLSDGTLVAEWVEARPSGGISFGVGGGSYSRGSGVGAGMSTSTSAGARWLRLTFGADGRLTASSRYRR